MSHTAYPTDSDIQTFVTQSGITVPTGYSFVGSGNLASSEWENRTGWFPFLKDSVDVTRTYDVPGGGPSTYGWSNMYGGGRNLLLQAGLLVLTSVSLQSSGVLDSTMYRLLPLNAPIRKIPYQLMQFTVPQYGTASAVTIIGRWGYTADIPEDAWQAMLRIGAVLALQSVMIGIAVGPTDIKQGDETFKWDAALLRSLWTPWGAFVDQTVSRYKMVTAGL